MSVTNKSECIIGCRMYVNFNGRCNQKTDIHLQKMYEFALSYTALQTPELFNGEVNSITHHGVYT